MKKAVIVLLMVATFAAIYYLYDPTHSQLAPKCIFHTLTGFDCPACGVQRVVHSLLHGNFVKAFFLNPFLVIAVPYLVIVAITTFVKSEVIAPLRNIAQHRYVIWGYVVIFFLWWIVRNSSWWREIVSSYC